MIFSWHIEGHPAVKSRWVDEEDPIEGLSHFPLHREAIDEP